MIKVSYDRGVLVDPPGLWLDSLVPREFSFVSHAHFDHMRTHRRVICSRATARLMRTRMPQAEQCEWVTPEFMQPLELGECRATLYPAGHVLGSAMMHVSDTEGDSVLYTGDFKLREGLTSEQPAPPRARQLIMETTYGLPRFVFPPTAEVVEQVLHFCVDALEEGFTPILFCYALGKAQEILSGLRNANLPVALHPQVAELAADYAAMGVEFPSFVRLKNPAKKSSQSQAGNSLPLDHVVLMPPNANGSRLVRAFKKRRTAMLTGWALESAAVFRYQVDAAFPLSDHADYPDLIRLVELVQPEIVHTLHGYSAEFAADLRKRGIVAWPLGAETQREFDLLTNFTSVSFDPSSASSRHEVSCIAESRGTFLGLAETARQIGTVTAKKEKLRLLAAFLRELPENDLPHAVRFLDARPLARADQRRLQIGTALLRNVVCRACSCTEAKFRAMYGATRDFARTVAAMMESVCSHASGLQICEVAELFSRLADSASPEERTNLLVNFLRNTSQEEAVLFCGIVTGDLRIGLRAGLVEEAIGRAFDLELKDVRQAHLVCGDLGVVAELARQGRLTEAEAMPFVALQPMLATAVRDAPEVFSRMRPPVWCEVKYDGVRCQLHKHGERVELFSRDLNAIGEMFPEIVAAARCLPSSRLILDGELLACRNGRPLPFAELQKLLGRKGRVAEDLFMGARTPLEYVVFDVLLCDEKSFLRVPLKERRNWLEQQDWKFPFRLIQKNEARDVRELEELFLKSLSAGGEGLMLKEANSFYLPGRRGLDWFKFKKELATLDCVVTAVEYGHGKRKNVLSDYTFAVRDGGTLKNIGKAYSGLTDEEIETLTAHFLSRVIEKRGRQFIVQPDVVLEIAFNGIAPSQRHESGLALRFPRIKRWRSDKTPEQADTLATARALAGFEA